MNLKKYWVRTSQFVKSLIMGEKDEHTISVGIDAQFPRTFCVGNKCVGQPWI